MRWFDTSASRWLSSIHAYKREPKRKKLIAIVYQCENGNAKCDVSLHQKFEKNESGFGDGLLTLQKLLVRA